MTVFETAWYADWLVFRCRSDVHTLIERETVSHLCPAKVRVSLLGQLRRDHSPRNHAAAVQLEEVRLFERVVFGDEVVHGLGQLQRDELLLESRATLLNAACVREV